MNRAHTIYSLVNMHDEWCTHSLVSMMNRDSLVSMMNWALYLSSVGDIDEGHRVGVDEAIDFSRHNLQRLEPLKA